MKLFNFLFVIIYVRLEEKDEKSYDNRDCGL